jgi:hypothetical protein
MAEGNPPPAASPEAPGPDNAIPEEQKRRVGDRPHLWTVFLSIAAIVISVLSYTESRRSRMINQEVNRPLVRAVSVNLVGPVMSKEQFHGPKFQNAYTITFRNNGKAFANDVHINFKAQIDDARVATGGESFARFSDFQDATIESDKIGDLAPDDEYPLSFWALVLQEPPTIRLGDNSISVVSLYVKGDAIYTNPINGMKYQQPFCFSDPARKGLSDAAQTTSDSSYCCAHVWSSDKRAHLAAQNHVTFPREN